MRDPRLVEAEFLMHLESKGAAAIAVTDDGAYFGTDGKRFRHMLYELLDKGLLNDAAGLPQKEYHTGVKNNAEFQTERATNHLFAGKEVEYHLTHRGRVHLWRLRDEFLRDAARDAFGILLDRRAWDRALAIELLFATANDPLAVVLVDLDHFKKVNDKYGHQRGDDVLRSSFALVKQIAGEAYRYGGEEIGILLPRTGDAQARSVAERVRDGIERSVAAEAKIDGPQTASIGLGMFTKPVDPKAAFEIVDRALYDAKTQGRNRVVVASILEAPSSAL